MKDIPYKFYLYDQITDLFDNYNCNITEDRIKIIKNNNKIIEKINENNINKTYNTQKIQLKN